MGRPEVVVFDVNETLSEMTALGARFVEVGAPETLAATWFAQVLRDGFALAATESTASFREIGAALLRPLLTSAGDLDRPLNDAVDLILDGVAELPLHQDVVPGVRALHAAGHRLAVLTNGATSVPEQLFTAAGIAHHFEMLLSVEDAEVWKPGAGAYAYAVDQCRVSPQDMVLVAVHPWDIHGAANAGLRTAWIDRDNQTYPAYCTPPDWTVTGVTGLSDALAT